MENLTVGDRVVYPGFKFRNESDRRGTIELIYFGPLTATGHRQKFFGVRFDDTGEIEKGFIEGGGLQREPLMVTRMLGA